MKAAILHGPRDLRVETAREPRPESGDVVVRIVAAGLCGTDYRIWTGERPVAYPRVMGHELVRRVAAVGSDGTRGPAGDAVVGAGTLGLLALQVLRARGARVLVVSRSRRRFALASELGAEATLTTGDVGFVDAGRRFSGREGVDLVVETAGSAEAVTHALELVRPGGRVVLTGLPHEPTPVPFFSVVRREVTITGSMIYQDEFPEALRLVDSGAVRTAPLITHRFSLDRIGEAFAAHAGTASIKVALEI